MYRLGLIVSLVLFLADPLAPTAAAAAAAAANRKDPEAVREVLAGKRTEANAAWWGYDEEDATEALQAAIRSGARRVVVPRMEHDWVVRPIQLAGNQELVLEPGVVVAAKRGEYRGGGDSVFTATGIDHLTIRGRGAVIRMHKEDYIVGTTLKALGWDRWYGEYPKAEWRMALALRGCNHVRIEGLTLRDSGGDGLYVDGGGDRVCSSDVHVKDVICENNYRQGFSVISVDGLVVEGCTFRDTWGTPPSAGVDLEPDAPGQKMKGVVFRNCRFEDNYGDGIEVYLAHLTRASDDVSIRFEGCRVTSRRGAGIRVGRVHDDGPGGHVEFRDCVVEATEAYGITVQNKAAGRARVRFVRCRVRDAARDRNYHGAWAPVWLRPSDPAQVKQFGGIDFEDCVVEDHRGRPVVAISPGPGAVRLADIRGTIAVEGNGGTTLDAGKGAEDVTLRLSAAAGAGPR